MHRTGIDLNGEWFLVFDPEDRGLDGGWFRAGIDPCRAGVPVVVPHTWEDTDPDYTGVGWYFKEFYAPRELAGRTARIRFGAVDYCCRVWLNGVGLGGHEGGYTPFVLEAGGAVRPGDMNRLVVRVVNPHGPDGYGDIADAEIAAAKELNYGWFAGIWQGVSLEAVNPVFIDDIFVKPDIDAPAAGLEVGLENRTGLGGDFILEAWIQTRGRVVAQREFDLRLGRRGRAVKARLPVPDPLLWSPAEPHLYELKLVLKRRGRVVDSSGCEFGMRRFTVRNRRFELNGEPVLVRGVLHQPDEPLTLAMSPDPEVARREVALAKDAGFNLIRLHIKTAHPDTLYWADRLGVMLYEEPPIGWIRKSERMRDRCLREVREMTLRDRNHPSLVIWGMLNEGGNAGYVIGGGAQEIKSDLALEVRRLDPTRLIIDDSAGVNTTKERSRYMLPGSSRFVEYEDLHVYQRAPADDAIEDHYRVQGDPGKLFFLSEFGFGGMEDLGSSLSRFGRGRGDRKSARLVRNMLEAAETGFRDRGLDRVFGDLGGFTAEARRLQAQGARRHILAVRSNPALGGYCYTQLFDAGAEFCAGVADRWRRPKPVFHAMEPLQRELILIPRLRPRNLVPGAEAELDVLVSNFTGRERPDAEIRVVFQDLTGNRFLDRSRTAAVPTGVSSLGRWRLQAPPGAGERLVQVVLEAAGTEFEAWETIHVLEAPAPAPVPDGVEFIGPEADTIWAYDLDRLIRALARAHGGESTLIVSEPPADAWELFSRLDELKLEAADKDAVGAFLGVYHWIKPHPVFQGLPQGVLMDDLYRNVIPARSFIERGVDDICGSLDTAPIADGHYMIEGGGPWWGADVSVQRLGRGFAVLSSLRLQRCLDSDPVAAVLRRNLIDYASELTRRARRSRARIEPVDASRLEARAMRMRNKAAPHQWRVIGPFPNHNCRGFDRRFPPEIKLDFEAQYQGWGQTAAWKPWHTRADRENLLDMQEAFTPIYCYYPRHDSMTGYAHTRFYSDRARTAVMRVRAADGIKVRLNGEEVFALHVHSDHESLSHNRVRVRLRKGDNELLVKLTKIPGRFRFMIEFEDGSGKKIMLDGGA